MDDGRPFDVEIGARASARRVRFTEVPDTEVRFRGSDSSESRTDRRNLPDEVEPGKTYRDVRVVWRAGARVSESRD
ncbi:MAG: hypothetical protein ACJ74L_13955 [Gaiellaceae bacterium]